MTALISLYAERPKGTMARPLLRLLVPIGSETSASNPMIQLGGRIWTVIDVPATESQPTSIPYVCVSYAHGKQRLPHPFDERQQMSSVALAAIEAALATGGVEALWVDAFSVPFDEEARATCLRQMGSIYGSASKVVVMLGRHG
jgi:hypothetical protein